MAQAPVTPTRIHKPMPLRGRRTAWPADAMGDQFSPNCLNVRFRFGEVRGTPGRNVLSGPVGDVNPLFIGQFPQLDGTVWVVMLTQGKLFRWGDSTPGTPRQWHQVLPGDVPPNLNTNRWSVAIGEGKMFFGREGDLLYYWDGVDTHPFFSILHTAGVQGINGSGGLGTAILPEAKFLEYFNNRLVVAWTFEGAATFSNRIRWSENGDFRHWDETVGLGAGFEDLSDSGQEPIRGMRSLADRIVLPTRNTVKEVIATGTLDPVFSSQTRVRGLGCNAPYTMASSGQQVIFMGYDRNVYAWNGIQMLEIGEPIFEELHAITTPMEMDSYFAVVSAQRQEYWLILPTGDAFVYDYLRQYWTRDTVPQFTALGEVEDTMIAPRWLDMTTLWMTEHHTWEELRGFSTTALFAGRPDGSTVVVDDTVTFDYFSIGSIVDRFLETPDFYTPVQGEDAWRENTIYRLLLVYQFVNEEPFEVSVSFDRGVTWNPKQVIPQQSGFSLVDFIGTGNTFRFRFRENNALGSFRWRSYSYEFVDGGDYIGTATG